MGTSSCGHRIGYISWLRVIGSRVMSHIIATPKENYSWLIGYSLVFSKMALVRIPVYQRLQSPGWTHILNTTFCRRTGRLIYRICLRLRTFGALWQQPFMHCWPRTSVTASIEAPSPKSKGINFSFSLSTLQNLIGSMPNRLKAVIKSNGDTIP